LNWKKLIILPFLFATLQMIAQGGASSFEFTENKGQWEKQVRFKSSVSTGAFFLQQNGFTVMQHNGDDLNRFFDRNHEGEQHSDPNARLSRPDRSPDGKPNPPNDGPPVIRSHAYRVQFAGANENCLVIPEKPVPTHTSYFIGNDPSKWAQDVPVYQAIVYKDIYPNIDIRYYSENGQLKYDLVIHPGGDVSRIAMQYDGPDKLAVRNNELIIKTSVGDFKELYPYSYQFDMTTGKKEISCNYELVNKNTVKFRVANYSKTSTLVIDPTLVFCSFTGSSADQYGYTATPGPDGSLFSGGIVFDKGFPVTTGAYQVDYSGGSSSGGGKGVDMGIFKFTPNGQRAYATYLGGNGNDYPHSLVCDAQGNLVIMGKTFSSNYPGTLKGKGGGSDIAVTKLNAAGTALIGSLRIGGIANDGVNIRDQLGATMTPNATFRFYGDDSRSEVILDKANNIYVSAQTQSSGAADGMPVTPGVFQPASGGDQDGTVIKINPSCTDITWCSYLGGDNKDGAFVLAINPTNQELYVAGVTTSGNFPPTSKPGVYQSAFQGGITDGFISRISNDGTTLISTTFMGTPSFDAIYGIHFDKSGIPYIMGVTEGNWPVINAAYSNPNSKQFIAKVKPDLSGFIYSTVFGNGSAKPNISPVAFLVDRCENVYISGWGGWLVPNPNAAGMDGVANMPITPDAIKNITDNRDFYFIVIKRDATGLLYGSYFGQQGGFGEHVDGGTSRYDEQGVIYQAICANCAQDRDYPITQRFPTTPGVWAPTNGSRDCNLAAVKIAFNFAGVAAGPKAYFNNLPDTMGCVPFTLQFRDTVRNAKSYEWDFDGDGVTDKVTTNFEETFTFNAIGTYRVRLIAIDPSTCNQRDTAYVTIRVRDDPAVIDFNAVKDGNCESLTFLFTNLSKHPAGKPFGPTSFAWDFGDGTPITPTNDAPVTHAYVAAGTYPIRLILLDTNFCNQGDWKSLNLGVVANVVARVSTPSMGCAPYNAFFNNTSLGGHDYFWDFGDGSTSTEMSPTHLYNNIGTYNIRMIVVDSNTCNKRDTLDFSITVNTKPKAAFSITPVTPEVNKPTTFLNQSIGGIRYKWFFGDGDSTITTDMQNVIHQYNATGTYTAELITYNQFECTDTATRTVSALIDPLLDVPNAFTPARGNRASIVKVAGFGIGKMTWRIYNRWGQKVFETTNRNQGWDGFFQGQLQPMDVYTYTLDVVFTDGRTQRKTGDITLIR
jgi:gliding motility-associated-like protein